MTAYHYVHYRALYQAVQASLAATQPLRSALLLEVELRSLGNSHPNAVHVCHRPLYQAV